MKTGQTFLFFLLAFIFVPAAIQSQEMTVKSMVSTNDQTANLSENLHKDLNDDYGGLVKVHLSAPNAVFEGLILEQVKHNDGEYWVFMAKRSSRLKVTVPGYIPLEVIFRDYGIEGIESRYTYALSVMLPQPSSTVSNSVASSGLTGKSSTDKEIFTVNGVSFAMVRVDGGTFTMGATDEQGGEAFDNEKPAHEVTLSTYMIGETEVTQALWEAVMGSNPSYFSISPEDPVERISWNDCQVFIKKLNGLTGKTFRLPTEAEWEFAARGGNKSQHYKYSGGNTCADVAWLWENSGNNPLSGEWSQDKIFSNHCKPHAVKLKLPNELGIYDLSGNVCEFCEDFYGSYDNSPQTNPKGASSGTSQVLRGGSCFNSALACRVSYRDGVKPTTRGDFGFRLAL